MLNENKEAQLNVLKEKNGRRVTDMSTLSCWETKQVFFPTVQLVQDTYQMSYLDESITGIWLGKPKTLHRGEKTPIEYLI